VEKDWGARFQQCLGKKGKKGRYSRFMQELKTTPARQTGKRVGDSRPRKFNAGPSAEGKLTAYDHTL